MSKVYEALADIPDPWKDEGAGLRHLMQQLDEAAKELSELSGEPYTSYFPK